MDMDGGKEESAVSAFPISAFSPSILPLVVFVS
jgi:hypothetical protein